MTQYVTTASLRKAVDSGNWFTVKALLNKRHVSKDVIEKSGLLHKLVTSTDISLTLMKDIVDKICSHHVDLNSLDEGGMGVLHRLCMSSDTEHDDILFLLLKKGVNINLTNIDNDTPLHVAAKCGSWRMMIALLRRGAKGGVANKEKRTVLHIFAEYFPSLKTLSQKYIDNIFTLLKKTSLHIDAVDCEGNTALHVAVGRGKSLIAEKLLTIGARADVVDADGRTVLHIMATQTHEYSSSFLMQIVKCGAKLEIKDCAGNTAFHLASIYENWHFLEMFTDTFVSKTDDNQIHFSFNDELRAAVEGRRWHVVKWMVKYSTDINKPDSQGLTLLQTLAQFNSDKNVDEAFSLLVDRGADFTVQTKDGENLLQFSIRHNNWLVAERLVRIGFGFCELDSEERLGLLQRLLEQKAKQPTSLFILLCNNAANITVRTQSGDTLLQMAAKHGNIAMVKYLARKSCRETLNKLDSEGFNIWHRLMQHQYEESSECRSRESPLLSVVNLLISKGADLLSQCTTGDTILHLAAKNNHWDIVNHLVEFGFDVNEADSEGLCLLHRLVKSKEDFRCSSCKLIENASYRLFQKLLRMGADPSFRTHSGDHVVHLAARQRNWTMVLHFFDQQKDVINELDSEGFNILHRLVQDNVTKRKSSLLVNLINKGVNPNISSPHAGSALNMAVKAHQWSFAILLVEMGADLDSQDPEGNTVLHVTAKMNNWSFVVYLLKKGAHAKLPDSEGYTVLHRCLSARRNTCGQLHQDCDTTMDLILNSDVDVTIQDPEGNLAIHLPAINGDMTLAYRLINTSVNLDLRDNEGFTWLMRASQQPSPEEERVNSNSDTYGAEANVNVDNQSLLYFIISNHKDIPLALLTALLDAIRSRGVDFNSRDYKGGTILFEENVYSTVSDGQDSSSSLFSLLVDIGVNPLLVDCKGRSLLRFALDLHGALALNLVKFLVQTGVTTINQA
ncbi:hypothetical protein C0Q70_04741 [Pomacea canaliculata]|uniref:Uncharacterized protein n=1 Tax=Pomacea canaliculata TaxID=400727 RepID=A0A2T7PJ79_POMCA|nr:hypothetical protein C0Q70_04741 [Pomacea canaliculata]